MHYCLALVADHGAEAMQHCLSFVPPTIDQLKTALSIIGSVVVAASMITSLTTTPAAGTKLARVYRYLELAALLFGRAKDRGLLPATAAVDHALAEAIALAKDAKAQREIP